MSTWNAKQPFAVFQYPDSANQKLILGKISAYPQFTLDTPRGFWFAPFDSKETSLFLKQELAYDLQLHGNQKERSIPEIENPGAKKDYIDNIEHCVSLIKKGTFEKIVLSRKIVIPGGYSFIETFKNLCTTYKNAFCYLFYSESTGVWLGATPEILLKYKNQTALAYALAGTLPVTSEVEPLWNSKEKDEQNLVTLYVREILESYSNQVKISATTSSRAGQLWHLKSELKAAKVPPALFEQMVQALHPTPAVLGIPKDSAMDFIEHTEGYSREFYTGFLGPSDGRQATLYVNLRCARWEPKNTHLFVGGGITAESDPEMEWEETKHKANTILRCLA